MKRAFAVLLLLHAACGAEDEPAAADVVDAGQVPEPDTGVSAACVTAQAPTIAAKLVLGQPDFVSTTDNNGGISAASFFFPWGLASDGDRLWVADEWNARVLRWDTLPAANKEAADLVIGQASATVVEPGRSATIFARQAAYVAVGGGKLVVADGNNRVLVWNDAATSSGQPADLVLGQDDFVSISGGNSATRLAGPNGVWTDGTRLVVADWGNQRVLIWSSFPIASGTAADVVLGWPAFGMGSSAPSTFAPASASSLVGPQGVFSDGTRLVVADASNNRVLIWSTFPTVSGEPADIVVGQKTFEAADVNGGAECPSDEVLDRPSSAIIHDGKLIVADTGNHRVLVFDPVPTASGSKATAVLGQGGFGTNELHDASAATFNSPEGLLVVDDNLFVSQPYWNRVSRFSLSDIK